MAQRQQLGAGWVPQLPGTPAAPAQGALLYVKSDGVLYTKNVAGTESPVAGGNPTGTILMWPTASAPAGYLLTSQVTFESTDYPALAAVLGDTYGTHTGTTYYLPDFRGRMPLGTGTANPAVTGGTVHALAEKGGEEKHSLTVGEMPAHSHAGSMVGWNPGAATRTDLNFGSGSWAADQPTHPAGGSEAFNVLNPYLGINFIIKT